jgi:hypothetical protein
MTSGPAKVIGKREERRKLRLECARDRSANQQMWPAATIRGGEQMHDRNISEVTNFVKLSC